MPKKKPIAVFDIDGTIFRSSLLIQLNDRLVRNKVFPEKATKQITAAWERWADRTGSYNDYLDWIIKVYLNDIRGAKVADIKLASRQLLSEQKLRVYVYTRDLIKKIRKTHHLVAISFSPYEAVKEFNKYYNFDIISGTIYEHEGGMYSGKIKDAELMDKKLILQKLVTEHGLSLHRSVGIGDTESDIEFLKLVDNPIAFNPNKKLYNYARKHGWEIVVERKDVVHLIQ